MANTHLHRLVDALEARLRRHPVAWAIAAAGFLGAIVLRIIDYATQDWVTSHLYQPVLGFAAWAWTRPVFTVTTLFLSAILVLVALSFWDVSPTAQAIRTRRASKQTPKALPLSWEEKQQVQIVRVFWERHGSKAAEKLRRVFERASADLYRTNYLSPLLENLMNQFDQTVVAMENSLAFEANTALDVVRSDLNNHVSMVGRISMWLSMIHANELPLTEEPRDRLLTAWLEIFPPFKAALEELALREEHQGRLSNPATWRDIPSHFRAPLKADMLLAEKAMESSSEDQKKFLSLFSMVELPRVLRGVPATHLPNNVYRAGLELAASGVLLRQQTTDGKDRFSMTEALSRAWGKENGEIVILREYVDIDPLTVQGTGSSGGGSRKGAGWLAGD